MMKIELETNELRYLLRLVKKEIVKTKKIINHSSGLIEVLHLSELRREMNLEYKIETQLNKK